MQSGNCQKINLLPKEIQEQRRFELWYPWIFSVTIIGLLIIGIVVAILGIGTLNLESELDKIYGEIEATTAQADALKKYEEDNNFLKARQEIVDAALADRLDAYLLSVAVTKLLPGPVSIERLTYDAVTGLVVQGIVEDVKGNPESRDWKGVAATMDSLESASIIRNAWLKSGILNDTYDGYEGFDSSIPGNSKTNYPEVVDQFEILADVKLTIGTDPKGTTWTDRDAEVAGR